MAADSPITPHGNTKPVCIHGHVIAEVGRNNSHTCRLCKRDREREAYRARAGYPNPIGRKPLVRDRCRHGHSYAEFGRWPNGACKQCLRLQGVANIPRYRDKRRGWKLQHRYGITGAEYDALLAKQDGVCAICGNPPKPNKFLDIDHDHETLKVRGLLCNNCNQAIGRVKNSLTIARALVAYLEKEERSLQVSA
jgi:hypothetical protein